MKWEKNILQVDYYGYIFLIYLLSCKMLCVCIDCIPHLARPTRSMFYLFELLTKDLNQSSNARVPRAIFERQRIWPSIAGCCKLEFTFNAGIAGVIHFNVIPFPFAGRWFGWYPDKHIATLDGGFQSLSYPDDGYQAIPTAPHG